jgi:hypothetical protein
MKDKGDNNRVGSFKNPLKNQIKDQICIGKIFNLSSKAFIEPEKLKFNMEATC